MACRVADRRSCDRTEDKLMEIMATPQDGCDSDADTVCIVWDSESDSEKTPKKRNEFNFGNDARRILPSRPAMYASTKKKCDHVDSDVIYVRGSDSECDNEDNVIVIDDSPRKLDVTHDLPEDFFDRETPPTSPQRTLQNDQVHVRQPEFSSKENFTCVEKEQMKRMERARVLLCRIDEQLLQQCQFTRCNDEHNTTHSHHNEAISVDIHEKSNHRKSIEQINKCVPSHPIVTQKEKRSIQEKIHNYRREKLSADESLSCGESVKVTLKIPLSKLLEIENNKKLKLQAEIAEYLDEDNRKSCRTREFPRSENTEYKLKNAKRKSYKKKGQKLDDDMKIPRVSEKQDVSIEKSKIKKKKKGEVASVCELCRTRVTNVTDHILHEHSDLFT